MNETSAKGLNCKENPKENSLTRRELLKTGAATLAGLTLINIAGEQNATAQESPPNNQATTGNTMSETTIKRGRMTGKRAVMEQLIADGVTHVFGNPGSTEQGFMDSLADYPQIKFILALHEGGAVSMADAYARMTGKPALVELHTAAGLGNAIGMMRNAKLTNTPLVVYAGHSDTRVLFQEPNLSGELVEMARPVTKWATQINYAHDVPQALRRAFKLALEAPAGPVFIALPIDAIDNTAEMEIRPTNYTRDEARPEPAALNEAATLLLSARNPMLMVGDGVGLADADKEAV